MFELVIENSGVEYVIFSAEMERDARLILQRHVRSLADGTATIREVKKKAKK